ncbi:MipA/OmpV family protein [Burkholderia seminalis]|uniref:MipA/OmpV family protein n=1 Tax=Burkholderia seminalis TaxID=488731 RepID=UPI001452B345|nr:MipA/OmpV family protein [Burkholderia seminalis]MCA8430164.1 MipA/OmpV family protein [Burkholderia seminalis]VWB12784.1 membrane protein [Burkholderia seminalis]
MKRTLCRKRPLLVAFTSIVLYSGAACADGVGAEPLQADDNGFTILSNATNVTHWGLGAGVGIESSPYRGDGSRVAPIPLISFDDKWVHAFGTTVDLKVGKWNDVTVALRGKFAIFDGYKGSDAAVLNGMADRGGAFWYGPALAWKTAFGTLSADYLLGGNKGQMANLAFSKSFDLGNWSIEPHAGIDWLSSKYVNYYYGVRPSEVRAGRPEYSGKAVYDTSIGTRVDYMFTRHQSVSLDLGVSRLGNGITDSPIVGRRYIPAVRIGYLYQFK